MRTTQHPEIDPTSTVATTPLAMAADCGEHNHLKGARGRGR